MCWCGARRASCETLLTSCFTLSETPRGGSTLTLLWTSFLQQEIGFSLPAERIDYFLPPFFRKLNSSLPALLLDGSEAGIGSTESNDADAGEHSGAAAEADAAGAELAPGSAGVEAVSLGLRADFPLAAGAVWSKGEEERAGA